MDRFTHSEFSRAEEADSPAAWLQPGAAVLIGTTGGAGMWSVVVALPTVQAEFGVARADASLPFTFTMIGFAFGGVAMGRLSDRFGIVRPVIGGTLALSLGYVLAGAAARNLWEFALAYGVLMGGGSAVTFGPLMVDLSYWFVRRRGIAVALVASGNYFAGTLWPPVVQHFIATAGWRSNHVRIGLFCAATVLPLTLLLRGRPSMRRASVAADALVTRARDTLALSPRALQALLCVAGLACCVAMLMPQVHLVAYCGALGDGLARGAEALVIGSALQGVALLLYLAFDGLFSLFVISALFGLFQGGIVPMYAVIIRDYFPPREAATRLGLVLMATLFGMALGGWASGLIFDLTGSYRAAFANGLLWNLVNVSIVVSLLLRSSRRLAHS